ncbi:hypothetical protein GCM10010109_85100 [Actinoplanes campanulatus]|nr:hypothetical protein GCM10010109_85100 [Actinoplanes campanulatus]GID40477.1 hypothetical protein Aca09nite_69830 [Actinoplanes campanulatus]
MAWPSQADRTCLAIDVAHPAWVAWYHPPRTSPGAAWSALLIDGAVWVHQAFGRTPEELRAAITAYEAAHPLPNSGAA